MVKRLLGALRTGPPNRVAELAQEKEGEAEMQVDEVEETEEGDDE